MRFHTSLLATGIALLAASAVAQPYGIESRTANTTLLITEKPADSPEPHQLVRAFPRLQFDAPRQLTVDPANGRLYVTDRQGIHLIPNEPDPDPATVSLVYTPGPDLEVLSLAFSPASWGGTHAFATIADPPVDGSRSVALWLMASQAGELQASAELHRWNVPDGSPLGGDLVFSADGYLHLAIADCGNAAAAQDPSRRQGAVLRLDVRGTLSSLPVAGAPGNSFGAPDTPAGWVYATGFRRPSLAIDPLMESVIVADGVDGVLREVTRVAAGTNGGWPIMAGRGCYPAGQSCNTSGLTRPLADSATTNRLSVYTGAFSYGPGAPDLHGWYLVADGAEGTILGARDGGGTSLQLQPIATIPPGTLTGLGQDAQGEVYFLGPEGGVWHLRPSDGIANSFPTRLRQLPALLAAGKGLDQTNAGIYPYEPSATLWSDGAHKSRFFALPGDAQIGWREVDGWDFPDGTSIIKNFLIPYDDSNIAGTLIPLETRLMLKLDGSWGGYSYQWNAAQDDAILLPRQRTRRVTTPEAPDFAYSWYYPSRTECFRCHTTAANHVLGISTGQMNYPLAYPASGVTDNQLRALNHISLFTEPLPAAPEQLPAIPSHHDTTVSVAERGRAYLHANCSYCHRPGGGGQIGTDYRWEIGVMGMGIVWQRPTGFELDIEDPWLVLPGHPEQSVLLGRMTTLESAYRMPPLATRVVDEHGLELINQWITGLESGNTWVLGEE